MVIKADRNPQSLQGIGYIDLAIVVRVAIGACNNGGIYGEGGRNRRIGRYYGKFNEVTAPLDTPSTRTSTT